jgi:glycerol-3-phosphate dehydrogenase
VINATGAFSDLLRKKAQPSATPMIEPSQGIHLVFGPEFLQTDSAILVPRTTDGRVLFAIPWHGHTLVGTTDTPISAPHLEPVAMDQEIEFILATAAQYLEKPPRREDVLSVFAGIRPLVRAPGAASTAALSRDHVIHIDKSGLMTITGGKWTTYRHMAEDCVDQAATLGQLPDFPCMTQNLRIHGFHESAKELGDLAVYGSDARKIEELMVKDPILGERLHLSLPYVKAQVIWAVREEMARTIEDVLARRTRALFLNARAALEMAPTVSELMAFELHWSAALKEQQMQAFRDMANNYVQSN